MKVRLVTVSQRQPAWVNEGEREYARRLPREWAFEVVEVKPAPRGKGVTVERVRAVEAERVRAVVQKVGGRPPRMVALDERGEPWSTAALVDRQRQWLQDGRDVVLVIGGADGMAPELVAAAHDRWSLSAATLPHGLVRIVVVEQLYRAYSIMRGLPYHRA